MNLEKAIEKYQFEWRLRKDSWATFKVYKSCAAKMISDLRKEPEQVSIDDIKNYLLKIENRNYHKQMVAAIRSFYRLVFQREISLKDIPYPAKVETFPDVLSVEEIQKLLYTIINLKHKCMIAIQYSCGLRVSEVINIEFTHIDRDRMLIKIVQAKGAVDRYVPLDTKILDLITRYYKAEKVKPKKYLFEGQFGGQYTKRSIQEIMKTAKAAAGIKKKGSTHMLRHSSATHRIEAGTDATIIQGILGHKNIKTTLKYMHISKAHLAKLPQLSDAINL